MLSLYHPQWDLTNDEIDSSTVLKRDCKPICIPPSWDLVQHYAGSNDARADGFDKMLFDRSYNLFKGDRSESEFLDVMRNLKIGGILVGDIRSRDLLNMEKLKSMKEFRLPQQLRDFIQQDRDFQIDFVYFHQTRGIIHFEVKKGSYGKRAQEQLTRNKWVLEQLFAAYCKLMGAESQSNSWDSKYFDESILFVSNGKKRKDSDLQKPICKRIWGKDELKGFRPEEGKNFGQNFFKDEFFRGFLLLIAGFRPDFFISPVKCAWQIQDNIFRHHANIINYYKNDIGDDGIQIQAKTLIDYFDSLQPFVTHKDIDFGTRKHIYLTKKQTDAVGSFDKDGNFLPTRQLIIGPPGSGKSLVLMIKIFVNAQIVSRKNIPLYYTSGSPVHLEELKNFVAKNFVAGKFCRKPKAFPSTNEKRSKIAEKCADVIVDESFQSDLSVLASQMISSDPTKKQIIAVVATGIHGDLTSIYHSLPFMNIDSEWFTKNEFITTTFNTVFRSTILIQNYFFSSSTDPKKKPFISGHNFHGVRVEEWKYPTMKDDMPKFVQHRIDRLLRVEEMMEKDICVFRGSEASVSCREFFEELRKKFTVLDLADARSMEFPIVLVVEANAKELFLAASRAMCYLIVFRAKQ